MLDVATRRREKLRNAVQGVLLLGGMAAILAVLAWTVLGQAGPFWVLMLGAALAVTQPQLSPRRILSLYGADPLPAYAAPELHWWVRVLAERADLPKAPDLYYLASPITNAFAVGRGDDAALAVTDGLLRRLTGRQVTAVLAHEISHIRAGDTTIMALST